MLGVLLFNVGNVFTVIFALEALVRMVAMGVWGHPHAPRGVGVHDSGKTRHS